MVFDVDGKAIHNLFSPCEIEPGLTVCVRCLNAAKKKTLELIDVLKSQALSNLVTVFSGRQGFHVYVLNHGLTERFVRSLVELVVGAGIPIDVNLALNPKAVVTFPGSIHGLSGLRAIPVDDLANLTLDKIAGTADTYLPGQIQAN